MNDRGLPPGHPRRCVPRRAAIRSSVRGPGRARGDAPGARPRQDRPAPARLRVLVAWSAPIRSDRASRRAGSRSASSSSARPPPTSDDAPSRAAQLPLPRRRRLGAAVRQRQPRQALAIDREHGCSRAVPRPAAGPRPARSWPAATQMGLRSFAFHPDFAPPGAARLPQALHGQHRDAPPAGRARCGLRGPVRGHHPRRGRGMARRPGRPVAGRPGVAARDPAHRAAQDGPQHRPADVRPERRGPATPGYGMLFIGVGRRRQRARRTPTPTTRRRTRAGRWARSCASTRCGSADGAPYGVPADNPFVGRAGYLPEIWALGLRHPQNLSFDRGGTGADPGHRHRPGAHRGGQPRRPGANYGWPLREGTFVTDRLRPDDALRPAGRRRGRRLHLPGGAVRPRRGRAAITGGFVYRGTAVPALAGHYLFGDIVNGRVFHVPVRELQPGRAGDDQGAHPARRTARRSRSRSSSAGRRAGSTCASARTRPARSTSLTKQDGRIRKLVAA